MGFFVASLGGKGVTCMCVICCVQMMCSSSEQKRNSEAKYLLFFVCFCFFFGKEITRKARQLK